MSSSKKNASTSANAAPDTFNARLSGPSPAGQVALDMVKRGLWVAPFLMFAGAAIWGGSDGAWSVGYGIALILLNFALSAALIAWGSRISLALLMGAVMFGFLIRLAIIFGAVYAVKDMEWVNMVALGVTIIVTHLGLLFWELRYVSASLASPGLKPAKTGHRGPRKPLSLGRDDSIDLSGTAASPTMPTQADIDEDLDGGTTSAAVSNTPSTPSTRANTSTSTSNKEPSHP